MRPRSHSVLLALCSAFVSLGAAEIALRLADVPHEYQHRETPPQFHRIDGRAYSEIGYLNRTSSEIVFVYDGDPRGYFETDGRVVHRTNSSGFRGPEFQEQHAPDVYRMAFVGDSFVFGEGVHFPDTFPEKLRGLLSHAPAGSRFEALNFGVGGFNTSQTAALVERFVLPHTPDVIVLGYTMNDVKPPLFLVDPTTGTLRRRPRTHPPSPFSLGFLAASKLARAAFTTVEQSRQSRRLLDEYRALYREGGAAWQRTEEALARIRTSCQELEIPCLAVLFPLLVDLGAYPLRAEHARVARALEEQGFILIDLLPALRDRDAAALWVHPTDHHPNEIVNRIVAELLAQTLVRSGFGVGTLR